MLQHTIYALDHCHVEISIYCPNSIFSLIRINSFVKYHDTRCPGIFPLMKTRVPTPAVEKQPQHLTFTPACFTVGTVHFGSNSSVGIRRTITFPSDPNKLNLLSSDHKMLFQKPGGFSRYVLANAIRLPRLTLLTYGFFRATRPKGRLRVIVDVSFVRKLLSHVSIEVQPSQMVLIFVGQP